MLENFKRKFIVVAVLCVSVGICVNAFGQIPPRPTLDRYFPTYNDHGSMDLYVTYPTTGQRQPFTSIMGIKKPSSTGKINFVIPVNGSIFFNSTFTDVDYVQCIIKDTGNPITDSSGNVIPPAPFANESNYEVTISGHPSSPAPFTRKVHEIGSYGLTASFNGLPSDKYSLTYNIEDKGPNYTGPNADGNLIDEGSVSLDTDVWAMDLVEQTRTIYLKQSQIVPISLKFTPADFPHENICYIVVSWGNGMPPMQGIPAPISNLFLDGSCTNALTGDTANSTEKSWQIGGSVPDVIYYKRPAAGMGSIRLILRVKDTGLSTDMVTKTLSFANADLYPHRLDKTSFNFSDYNNSNFKTYAANLWVDRSNPADGLAYEEYPYQNSSSEDNNRPFVFTRNQPMTFNNLSILIDQSLILTGSPKISGTGTGNIAFSNIPFFTRSSTWDAENISSTNNLPDKVDILNFSIAWKLNYGNGQSKTAGSTDFKAYVTYAVPVGSVCCSVHPSGLYESVLNISCNAAKGKNTQQDVFDAIWNKVKTLSLKTLDGRTLKYYGAGKNTAQNEHDSTVQILRDADGRCGNWATFFIDLLKSQGVHGGTGYLPFRVKKEANPTFKEKTLADGRRVVYTTCYGQDYIVAIKQSNERFQGGGNPNDASFPDHVINTRNGVLYDATSGATASNFVEYVRKNIVLIYLVEGSKGELEARLISGENLGTDSFVLP